MNDKNIHTIFSIKDLENLSGIKAHTIRIWEKRFNLLIPSRSETNIRNYDNKSLQKLLNIKLLLEHGFKISKIALLNDEEIANQAKNIIVSNIPETLSQNSFKFSMLNFDEDLFESTYQKLISEYIFSDVFYKVFIPFLEKLGFLWQTNTITPAHEHFISNLIKQKVLLNIEKLQMPQRKNQTTYVLFLPLNEIHELGLLFIHYKLKSLGLKSVYLGSSVPIENLNELINTFPKLEFISYFTVKPDKEDVLNYLEQINNEVLSERNEKLHIIGRNTLEIMDKELPKNIKAYPNISVLIDQFI